ncbi:MAG TPA: hypothetical protein VEW46_16885 [Pyrinomonadaceae bacterium]|nr:hypothetical protein [Pyrinomonadaceae bacterium]
MPTGGDIKTHRSDEPLETFALGHVAANQGREHGADVDAHIKNREPTVASRIVFAVQITDHCADVWLE